MAAPIKKSMLFIGNLPKSTTDEDLQNVFSEVGEIKRCTAVRSKDDENSCRGFGFVTYSLGESVEKALKRSFELNGYKLRVQCAVDKSHKNNKEEKKTNQKERKKLKSLKKPRLIIRNVPFKADEKCLRTAFSKFGSIVDLNIPKDTDGKKRGFAFIQFDNMKSAINAVNAMNAQKLLGRTIAVDFAVSKEKFNSMNDSTTRETSVDGENSSEDESPTVNNPAERASNDSMEHSTTNSDVSDESAKEDHLEEDSDYISDDEDKSRVKRQSNDATDGRTLFIRNVSFATEGEDLREAMEKFGRVQYALLCMDKEMERPKGTAFVRFETRQDAEKCLITVNTDEDGLILDGRKLSVSPALSQDQVKFQKNDMEKNAKGKDKRNLYLAREGLIRPGSEAAQGVSKGDLAKRMQRETMKRKLLRNLHNFVSNTRLCVHNMPFSIDDSKLKQIFLKAVDDKGAKITEARVIKDNSSDKSKGFGFVAFVEHEHALKALRALNNNPDIFTAQRRPVVEFSVENLTVLNMKEKRLEKSRKNLIHVQQKVGRKFSFRKRLEHYNGDRVL